MSDGEVNNMKIHQKKLPVQNCSILVRDSQHDDPLFIEHGERIAFGKHGLSISCIPDSDGDVSIMAGPVAGIIPDNKLIFSGAIATPSRIIIVETILGASIFEIDVESEITKLSIWTDGHPATDRITIGIE
jgi:hypothetical protein